MGTYLVYLSVYAQYVPGIFLVKCSSDQNYPRLEGERTPYHLTLDEWQKIFSGLDTGSVRILSKEQTVAGGNYTRWGR